MAKVKQDRKQQTKSLKDILDAAKIDPREILVDALQDDELDPLERIKLAQKLLEYQEAKQKPVEEKEDKTIIVNIVDFKSAYKAPTADNKPTTETPKEPIAPKGLKFID